MTRTDASFRLKVVEQYLAGPDGVRRIAARHGITFGLVQSWVARYRHHGPAGLAHKRGRYDTAFKLKVLGRMQREGLSYRQTAALFDIRGAGAIARWQCQYDSGELGAPAPAAERPSRMRKTPAPPKPAAELTLDEAREELLYLRAENALLKKLKALAQEDQAAARNASRKSSKG